MGELEERWWIDCKEHLQAGLGFVEYRTSRQPFHGRVPDFHCWKIDDVLPLRVAGPSALVLPLITAERFSDPAFVSRALRVSEAAVDKGVAVVAATELTERQFASTPATSDKEPWELDVDAVLSGARLVLLLETHCLARARSDHGDAVYLTPIEARLARELDRRGIAYERQHFIGEHCVDFLLEGRLVVECDGFRYHDPMRDSMRDEELRHHGYQVLRLPGRLIHHDCTHAARLVAAALDSSGPSVRALPGDLSVSQREAVAHDEGPARLSAPAGSGKTRVIKERVERLVHAGVAPSRICAISFTNRAVDEMRSRLAEVDAAGAEFTTLHKLAKEISENGPQGRRRTLIQGGSSSKIPTRWGVLAPLIHKSERFFGDREVWLDAMSAYRQGFGVPDFSEFPAERRPSSERLIDLHRNYDEALEQKGLTDFEGYILNAVRNLARSAEYRTLWASKYDFWIVDEYQDLPAGKLALVRLLTSPRDNLFVVGDDDQIIYGFAGASPKSFAAFVAVFPDSRDFVLGDNYRCDHEIVVRSSWLISRNRHRTPKPIRPVRHIEPHESVVVADPDKYDRAAVEFVQSQLIDGLAPHEIAVLFRLRDYAVPVERRLEEMRISYTPCSYGSFFKKTVVRQTRAWLRLVAGIASKGDVRECLKLPTRYLTAEHLDAVEGILPRSGLSASKAQQAALAVARDLTEGQKRHALETWVSDVDRALGAHTPAEILDALGMRSVIAQLKPDAGEADPRAIFDVFYRLAAEFANVPDLEAWIVERGSDRDYSFDPADSRATASAQDGRVLLASIHQVKGQEFEAVAVVGPPHGMPDRRAVTPEQLEEERRIAYVGVTRAKSVLLFAASVTYADELSTSHDGVTWDDYRTRATEVT